MWKRFVGFMWDDGHSPVDPGFGGGIGAPVDPGYGRPGWSPADPGYGVGSGLHPSHGLPGGGHISTGPIYGGGHPGNKPPGRPIIPVHPGQRPPMGGAPPHPWTPGDWDIIDPGWGKPPVIGFFPVDPGWGMPEGSAPDNTLPGAPQGPTTKPPVGVDNTLPGSGGGNWVPTDPDYGIPSHCPGAIPKPPRWGWVPKPPDLSKPVEPAEPPTATPK